MIAAGRSLNPWVIACRSRELPSGRALGVVAEGHALALFRDARGIACALEDRCAHRNAPLSLGKVARGCLECAYHGWRYDGLGRVTQVPALPEPEAARSAHAVKRYPVSEQDGFVWVSVDDAHPATAPLPFSHLGEAGWTSFTMKTLFRAPVEACLENFLDVPHATFLHRYWFRAPTAREIRAVVRTLEDGAEAEFFEEPRERSFVWWLLAPRGGAMRHTDRFIAPRTSRVDYEFPGGPHYIVTSSCTPVDERRTQVYTVISFRFPLFGALVRLIFEPLSRRIIRQDVDMLDAQYANVERFRGPAFASTRADLLGRHIAAWRGALTAGTPPPAAGQAQDVVIRI
jgi:phenylpropionate dioxygenase-like ring-hydroxylating dioxygenase large terminal subunit